VKKLIWPLVIIVAVTVADQLTKSWRSPISPGNHLNHSSANSSNCRWLQRRGRDGTAFGSSTGYLIMALIILPILGYYSIAIARAQQSHCAGVYLWWRAWNVIDRVRFGRVTDFIDVDIPDINLLDSIWNGGGHSTSPTPVSPARWCADIYMLFYKPGRKRRQPSSGCRVIS